MSKREVSLYIVDIYIANEKIKRYTAKFSNHEELLCNELHWDATLREFQIIGDATGILIREGILSDEYRMIVDFRNLITHAYFGIDSVMIWDIITKELPAFIQALEAVVLNQNIDLTEAIDHAVEEEKKHKNRSMKDFLINLKK